MKSEDTNEKPSHRCPLPATCFGYRDATELACAYADGRADPEAVTQKCLASACGDDHVYISVTRDRALFEARHAAERYRAGCPLSAFDGVPTAWKDLFFLAGSVTTAGSLLYRDNKPDTRDSTLARFAARAGMVSVGKLNLSEFAYSSVGYNPHYGTPRNPHGTPDCARVPGGSSSGSAVAVAAGMLPVSIGSDTGGSIRVPAAFNGVFGFKPSKERYSLEGAVALSRTLDTAGTFARSMRDLVSLDRILRACPFEDFPEFPAQRMFAESCRFVVDEELWAEYPCEDAVKRNFEAVIARLESAGACVIRRRVAPFRDAMELVSSGWLTGAEVLAELEPVLSDPQRAAKIDPLIRERIESARSMRPEAVVRAYWGRAELTRRVREDLGGAILLSLPVGHVAPALGPIVADKDLFFEYIRKNIALTLPGNAMDMPGISMPTGVDADGMPTSVLLSAPSGCDDALLAVACEVETIVSGAVD